MIATGFSTYLIAGRDCEEGKWPVPSEGQIALADVG